MEIPEINDAQLYTLCEMVEGTNMFFQLVPDAEKDTKEEFASYTKGNIDSQHLVNIGMLRDITPRHQEQLDRLFISSGRAFKAYETTEIARTLFNRAVSRAIN